MLWAMGVLGSDDERAVSGRPMGMLAVLLVYAGFVVTLVGAISLTKPLAWFGIHERSQGAFLFGLGLVAAGAGFILPAREVRVETVRTQLDGFAPAYHFNEFHSVRVVGSRERAYRAIKTVTADEILLFRTLTWIRRLGRGGPETILKPRAKTPILEVATRTGFVLLADEPDREVVLGTAVIVPRGWQPKKDITPDDFKTLREPGFAIAAMNFLIEDAGSGGCTVTTETRAYATDAATRRRFARYWRVIYPGSALIRRMWLRAVKRQAENPRS